MSEMKWTPELDVGVDAMNNQHKRLIQEMNVLYRAYERGASAAELAPLIASLAKVTTAHFKSEEGYMAKIGYPQLEQHKLVHVSLLRQFDDHVEKFERERALRPEFFGFLRFWLTAHICGIDTQYGKLAATG